MKKVMIFFVSLFFLVIDVEAYSAALVMDADSGRVLYSDNASSKMLIASTTKIMTALVVLNNTRDLDRVVEAGDEILDAYGSSIYLKPKEKMSIRDLLYGLMLRSGNDAALVLAKNTAGSIEGFVRLMNDTALMIGMHDSTFSNPHGLDEETQNKSTVYDMCLLMKEAMQNDEFKKITSTKKYTSKSNFASYEWINKNKLLTDYKYATGGKIGYTTSAKHTFVSSASKDDKNLIIATFIDPDRFDTHKNLYEKYFDLYDKYTLIDKDDLVIDYKKGYKVYTTDDFAMLLNDKEKKTVKREVELYQNIGEITSSKIIGTIAITLEGETLVKQNIYAEKIPKEEYSFWDKIRGFFRW